MGGLGNFIPKSTAQWAGVLVAGIVTFGADTDIFYAIPLGVFSGALATLFVSLSDMHDAYRARWTKDEEFLDQ
jgi:hypothetical protein